MTISGGAPRHPGTETHINHLLSWSHGNGVKPFREKVMSNLNFSCRDYFVYSSYWQKILGTHLTGISSKRFLKNVLISALVFFSPPSLLNALVSSLMDLRSFFFVFFPLHHIQTCCYLFKYKTYKTDSLSSNAVQIIVELRTSEYLLKVKYFSAFVTPLRLCNCL